MRGGKQQSRMGEGFMGCEKAGAGRVRRELNKELNRKEGKTGRVA